MSISAVVRLPKINFTLIRLFLDLPATSEILIFGSVVLIKQNKQDNAHAPRVHWKYVLSHNHDCACVTLASILRRNTGDGSTSDQASSVAKAQGKGMYESHVGSHIDKDKANT